MASYAERQAILMSKIKQFNTPPIPGVGNGETHLEKKRRLLWKWFRRTPNNPSQFERLMGYRPGGGIGPRNGGMRERETTAGRFG